MYTYIHTYIQQIYIHAHQCTYPHIYIHIYESRKCPANKDVCLDPCGVVYTIFQLYGLHPLWYGTPPVGGLHDLPVRGVRDLRVGGGGAWDPPVGGGYGTPP